MVTIRTNCEFASELICVIPYAYWLHQNNKLEKVITSKGMKPFYYFCDDVEERYEYRTVDNKAANMDSLPNGWIYGSKDNELLGFVKSISYSVDQTSPYETDVGYRVPTQVTVAVSYQVIHGIVPSLKKKIGDIEKEYSFYGITKNNTDFA